MPFTPMSGAVEEKIAPMLPAASRKSRVSNELVATACMVSSSGAIVLTLGLNRVLPTCYAVSFFNVGMPQSTRIPSNFVL